jgi:hypothetical protein
VENPRQAIEHLLTNMSKLPQENLRQAVENLLTTMSKWPPPTHCPYCHLPVEARFVTFFFYNDREQSWTIPLSNCPSCEAKGKAAA